MNRTLHQWQSVDPWYCAKTNSEAANAYLMADMLGDIKELTEENEKLREKLRNTIANHAAST